MDKQSIILTTLIAEGYDPKNPKKSYVNNPNDSGGETMLGITKAVAQTYKSNLQTLYKWNGKMIDLTLDMAIFIYTVEFWNKMKLDNILGFSPIIAERMFDIGVNCGVYRANTWFQQTLMILNRNGKDYPDIKDDGVIGNQTLTALNGLVKARGKVFAEKSLMLCLVGSQTRHYMDISLKYPKNETFTAGWLSRAGEGVTFD